MNMDIGTLLKKKKKLEYHTFKFPCRFALIHMKDSPHTQNMFDCGSPQNLHYFGSKRHLLLSPLKNSESLPWKIHSESSTMESQQADRVLSKFSQGGVLSRQKKGLISAVRKLPWTHEMNQNLLLYITYSWRLWEILEINLASWFSVNLTGTQGGAVSLQMRMFKKHNSN